MLQNQLDLAQGRKLEWNGMRNETCRQTLFEMPSQ
jgi:hypothetical protein